MPTYALVCTYIKNSSKDYKEISSLILATSENQEMLQIALSNLHLTLVSAGALGEDIRLVEIRVVELPSVMTIHDMNLNLLIDKLKTKIRDDVFLSCITWWIKKDQN